MTYTLTLKRFQKEATEKKTLVLKEKRHWWKYWQCRLPDCWLSPVFLTAFLVTCAAFQNRVHKIVAKVFRYADKSITDLITKTFRTLRQALLSKSPFCTCNGIMYMHLFIWVLIASFVKNRNIAKCNVTDALSYH